MFAFRTLQLKLPIGSCDYIKPLTGAFVAKITSLDVDVIVAGIDNFAAKIAKYSPYAVLRIFVMFFQVAKTFTVRIVTLKPFQQFFKLIEFAVEPQTNFGISETRAPAWYFKTFLAVLAEDATFDFRAQRQVRFGFDFSLKLIKNFDEVFFGVVDEFVTLTQVFRRFALFGVMFGKSRADVCFLSSGLSLPLKNVMKT